MKYKFAFLLISVVTIISSCTKINDGSDVIHLMKKKYNNSYIKNFTFSQYVTQYEKDSVVHKTVWHEAYSFPNQLIIKFDSFDSGNGYIFNRDTVYIIKNNKVDKKARDIHDLIILGFDIYEQPFQTTYDKLTEIGYDLSKVCETNINGRDVYCVGVENETVNRNKFYIDKENLCFIKNVKYYDNRYSETVFADYKKVKDKFVATKVLFYNNGQIVMKEEYYNINFPESLNSKVFEIKYFKNATW